MLILRHRVRQQSGYKLPRRFCRDRCIKKDPDVRAVAGTGALKIRGNVIFVAYSKKSFRGGFIPFFVKIRAAKSAGLVRQHRIDADHVPRVFVFALRMGINILIRKRQKLAVRAVCAFILLFIAQRLVLLVAAHRLISAFTGGHAVPPPCKNVRSSREQRTEQCDLLLGRTVFVYGCYGCLQFFRCSAFFPRRVEPKPLSQSGILRT